ncbi:DMT family transporter [Acidianus brierleyi]|uniref:Permease n=1 Tax=Acidianus brierleyi TaxID=41673 RepID=A0A2U9IGL3_9CREN|nr:EamA family transporter [Acidianus brierleyi]AWR95150.1 EamA family transporter [Acidianus brierleyi]
MHLKKGFYDLLLTSFLWGTIGIATQFFYIQGANPYSLVLFRSISSAIISFFIIKIRNILNLKQIILGLFAAAFYETYIYTITIDGAALSAVLLYTAPLWVFMLSKLLVKESTNAIKIISSICIVIGLYIIYEGTLNLMETLLGLMSGFTYALLVSYSRYLQIRGSKEWEMIASQSIWSIPFVIILEIFSKINLPSIFGGIYLGIFATILPYFFFYRGMKKSDSGTATIISALEPVFTIILAYIFLKESLNFVQFIGTIIILISVIINGMTFSTSGSN